MVEMLGSEQVGDAGFVLASKISALQEVVSSDEPSEKSIVAAIKATADALDAYSAATKNDLKS